MIYFYAYHKQQMLLISDLQREKIKDKYGPTFEIVNSVKDKDSLTHVKPRIVKQFPRYNVIEDYFVKRTHSEETKKKQSEAKLGKPRPDWVREKISKKMKGKSNFEGKKHRIESRIKTSVSMMENKCIDGHRHIYNPTTNEERRVKDIINLPKGFRLGRNPDVIETFRSGSCY